MIVYDPKRKEPHWAPGAAEYLANQIRKDDHCFEWGGGMSTQWLCELVPDGGVITVEDDPVWIERIMEMTEDAGNFGLFKVSRDSRLYVDEVDRHRPLSVYLIDGYRRIECLDKALEVIGPGGILVLDDALDYVGDWKPPGVVKFSMPHPYAGKRVERNQWGNTLLKVGDLHHDTKETWIWKVCVTVSLVNCGIHLHESKEEAEMCQKDRYVS